MLYCTEISLLVSPDDLSDVALYDTTALHVDRAVQSALGVQPLPDPLQPDAEPLLQERRDECRPARATVIVG